jgi:hypothetical protein
MHLDLRNVVFMKLLDGRILWRASDSNRGSKKGRECCVIRRFIIGRLTICRAIKLRLGHVGHRGVEKYKYKYGKNLKGGVCLMVIGTSHRIIVTL